MLLTNLHRKKYYSKRIKEAYSQFVKLDKNKNPSNLRDFFISKIESYRLKYIFLLEYNS